MAFKRLFHERGTYDVTPPVSTLQQRCNELTSVTVNMADLAAGYNKTVNDVQAETMTPTKTTTFSKSLSMAMPQAPRNMHVDAIVEVEPTSNIGFNAVEVDNKSQKADRDLDTLSNSSKSNKCENCIVNCLYYSHECCDCTII
ncbi:hypothetical protein KPH14_007178 [Odynerus spinipes]|uniref:Uncharacterized protein n=1 Tax=Odynerus spinipes TaxID=1348599 RepID=A0AAD9VID9_9HYME|nr:hypothetical protein KPH14_007178 [Odynerus spinipes]